MSKKQDTQSFAPLFQLPGYRTECELGTGGMGVVYLVFEEEEKTPYALKLLKKNLRGGVETKRRFLREMEINQLLEHPNLVAVRDAGEYDGTVYLLLDYCNAGTLREHVDNYVGHLPPYEALNILMQLLDGLEYAHSVTLPEVELESGSLVTSEGLVHRDLKPENILLCETRDGLLVKIGDFGLAKAYDLAGMTGFTRTGTLGGSLGFVPRQQIVNYKYVKPEVDVWAAIACLYYMLTKTYPRDLKKHVNPIESVLSYDPIPIKNRRSALAPALASLIDEALLDKEELRFKSVPEFRDALKSVM